MKRAALTLLAVAVTIPAHAHTHLATAFNIPYFQDYGNVSVFYNEALAPGLQNANGRVMIAEGSNPVAALQAAAASWSNIEGSRIRIAQPTSTALSYDSRDRVRVITFKDSPEIRSIVGDALAVTLTVAVPSTGEVLDADILFSPSTADAGRPFSTNGAPNTYDLQSVAVHELGHTLGAGHSHLLAATMFPFLSGTFARILNTDDLAFAREAAPVAGTESQFGELRGNLTLPGGQPARGIAVTANDPVSGAALGALSDSTGAYSIRSMPPGNYVVFAEPLDGPTEPTSYRLNSSTADMNVDAVYFAGKTPVAVNAGATSIATFAMPVRTGAVDISFYARGQAGRLGDFTSGGAIQFAGGESFDILIGGDGLDASLTPAEIEWIGPGIRIRPGSLREDTLLAFSDGSSPLRFTVDLDDTQRRSIASLVVRHAGGMSTIPAALVVTPTLGQTLGLVTGGIVNAATSAPGPLAPSSWVSIYANNLARELIVGPASLSTQIDGTSVSITDSRGITQLARLQFVSPQQINFLMPTVLGSGTARLTVTSLLGKGSADIQIQSVSPGIFSANSSGAGPAASSYLTVLPGGAQESGFTFRADTTPRQNLPIDLMSPAAQVYLTFYGTGLRAHFSAVTATIGLASVPVLAAVAQGQFAGLDQINVGPLPQSLRGSGEMPVAFQVDGRTTNPVTVNIK